MLRIHQIYNPFKHKSVSFLGVHTTRKLAMSNILRLIYIDLYRVGHE